MVGNAHVSGSFISGNTTTYGDGSITLSTGTDLNVDSNTLFIDNANNRVGIGTAGPSHALDVVGNAHVSGSFISGNTTTYGDGSITLSTGTDLNVDSNTLFVDNANNRVGIGTAGPSHALDVVGNAHVSGSFISGNTTTYGDGSITLSTGTDLNVDSNTLFVDNANNRVGIGTAGPSHALDVVGDAHVSGNFISGNTTTYGDGSIVLSSTDLGITGGDVGIGTLGPLATLHVSGTSAGVDGSGGSNIMFGDEVLVKNEIGFFSASDTNNRVFHKVATDNSGNNTTVMTLTGTGRVGVGITGPNHPLYVVGNVHASGSFIAGSTTTYGDGDISFTGAHLLINGGNVGIATSNTTGFSGRLFVGGGHVITDNNFGFLSRNSTGTGFGAGIDTHTDDSLFLYAGGTERMRITPDGRVGIGTTDPGAIIQISRTGVVRNTCGGDYETGVSALLFKDDPAGGCGDQA